MDDIYENFSSRQEEAHAWNLNLISFPKMAPAITVLERNGRFCSPAVGESRRPFGKADELRKSDESFSWRQEYAGKTEVLASPWCRTLCFHVLVLAHVSKTPFFACFSRKICSPGGNPLGRGETKSSQNDRKNTGFWKLADQNDCKNKGFCIGAEPKPRFFSRFHVAGLSFI